MQDWTAGRQKNSAVWESRKNEVMKQAFAAFGFTARTYHKVLKVARTIADLDGSQEILKQHLCEAIGYRTPDKKYWKR